MSYNFNIVNVDTDAITVCKPDQSEFSKEEITQLTQEINSLTDELIKWEFEFYAPKIVVIKSKNYIIKYSDDKITIKGSGLKATNKEKRFKRFINDVIQLMLNDKQDELVALYNACIIEICNLTDISEYCSKKTVTKAVLEPKRTNEQRVKDALGDKPVQEGDKVYMFFKTETELCLQENFSGEYDKDTLLEKLFKTIKIFETIVDIKQFPNYTLKKNKNALNILLGKKDVLHDK